MGENFKFDIWNANFLFSLTQYSTFMAHRKIIQNSFRENSKSANGKELANNKKNETSQVG